VGDFKTIIYEKSENTGFITLNRPEALNVYNMQMRDDLYQALSAVKDDPDVRVLVLKGAGEKAFCAGADLTEFLTAPSPVIARQVRWQRDVWGLFLSISKPVIAALHGYVFGDGVEMAMCCDIRIASEDAVFGVPEMGLGIIPAAGGSQTIPRAIGRGHALDMLLSGRWVKADEACRLKLINKVVPRDKLVPEVIELADKIKAHSSGVLSYAKQAICRGLDMSLEQGLELERRLAEVIAID